MFYGANVESASRQRPWTDPEILRALGEWEWAPEGTEVIDNGDFRLQFRPDRHGRAATVSRVESDRSAEAVVAEVNDLARARSFDEVSWNLYPTSRPRSLRDVLLEAGAVVRDEGAVMSLRVPPEGLLDVGPIDGVVVRPVLDVHGLTDYRRIISQVYEQRLPSPEEITEEAAGIPQDLRGRRFVAYLGDEPVGSGAIAIRADGSASLFGAATYPEFRRRGAYRAIMAARVRWAWQHAVPVLLVSGRLSTSAPIMRRIGFTHHGYTCTLALRTR